MLPDPVLYHLCVPCSGESGAGKTESCKFIVAELIELSHGMSVLEQKILQVSEPNKIALVDLHYPISCSSSA